MNIKIIQKQFNKMSNEVRLIVQKRDERVQKLYRKVVNDW